MATIRAFRGIRYNQMKVTIANVVAPPYDVITAEQQNGYYDKDPFNVVRLILGREENRYGAAAKTYDEWQKNDALLRDLTPSIYPLVQTFKDAVGKEIRRKGFIALCRLEEFEKKIVLPHEKTLSKAKEDRFKLFKATQSNFSQVFSLYSDAEKQIDHYLDPVHSTYPVIDVEFEGVRNQLWQLSEASSIDGIAKLMEPKQVLIADGHHRYETGLAYRDLMKSQNLNHTGNELYNYIMMFFTNLDDEGLVIFPTHRVIHSLRTYDGAKLVTTLQQHFDVQIYPTPQMMTDAMKRHTKFSYGFVSSHSTKYFVASLKDESTLPVLVRDELPGEVKGLDVVLLHNYILRDLLGISQEAQEKKLNIHYLQSVHQSVDEVASGASQIAFFINPTKIEQVRAVCKSGNTMPQKSTFFFPKLISGLVLNKMAE
ncbi:MAG: DUF1015 domain-containing protein [Bacteroidetes bacterium]|nr:DUF1015 domain-containing protein [Bacteroidota bacterium]